MKQTSVEWLGNEITNRIVKRNPHDTIIIQTQGEILIELIEQAKAMEKNQHQETFKQSRQAKIFEQDMPPVWKSFEQYYNKTFKSE